jgi:antitoxin YefM
MAGDLMATEITYTALRENLARVLDRVIDDQETVIVRRKNGKDVALMPAAELTSLMETDYVLRSPENAKRLHRAIRDAKRGRLRKMTMEELRREVGL